MCDYSLRAIDTRPAKVGDRLVMSRFADTLTQGFAAVGESDVAVCLLPGTEIVFEQEAERLHLLSRLLPRLRLGRLGGKVARFRQVNMDRPNQHHDALEFADGNVVLLTNLIRGQQVTVLQLPAPPPVLKQGEEQKRPAQVC
jgi:hypothetical protein